MSRSHSARLTCGLTALLVVPVLVGAQALPVQPGMRVRLTAPDLHLDHVQGVVSAVHGDTLAIAMAWTRAAERGPLAVDTMRFEVPIRAVTALEVSTEQASSAGKGALIGAAAGAAVGGIFGGAVLGGPVVWGTAGALSGALEGMIIGGMFRHDVWQSVTLPTQATPVTLNLGRTPLGGETIGVGVALRF